VLEKLLVLRVMLMLEFGVELEVRLELKVLKLLHN